MVTKIRIFKDPVSKSYNLFTIHFHQRLRFKYREEIISCILLIQQDYTVFTSLISVTDFSYLLILGTLCTAMVFVWMTEIMKHITPYSLIMAVNLEPIYSIILALLIFGDSELMSISFYIGSSVIIGIVFLEGYLKNKQ